MINFVNNSEPDLTAENLNKMQNDLIEEIKKLIKEDNKKKYYVGKIILDTKNINPSTYLGFGTWVLWGSGRVPVGVDTSDTKFNTVEKTGGSNSVSIAHTHKVSGNTAGHKLTVNEIPSHTHKMKVRAASSPGDYYGDPSMTNANAGTITNGGDTTSTGGGQAHSHSISLTSESGGSSSISTVQKYITCYMWKRTA